MRSETPIRAPPALSEISPVIPSHIKTEVHILARYRHTCGLPDDAEDDLRGRRDQGRGS